MRSLPSLLSITLDPSPSHCQSSWSLTCFTHSQSPWVPNLTSTLSNTLNLYFSTINHPDLFNPLCQSHRVPTLPPHCQSPWILFLHTIHYPEFLPPHFSPSITPGLSFTTVNHHGFKSSPLSITPGPSPPQYQSARSLPSSISITKIPPLPSSLPLSPGPSPSLLTLNHPSSSPPLPTVNHLG